MAFSPPHQLDLPEPFPQESFARFYAAARAQLPYPSQSRNEFNGAGNLIGWRFRACLEYRDSYMTSWNRIGPRVDFDDHYTRERDIFGMFSCGVAALEATCYACHALASVVPPNLPFDERARRASSAARLLRLLEREMPNAVLATVLSRRLESATWNIWVSYRNTMTHRANIPAIIYGVGDGGQLPPALPLDFPERWSHPALRGDEADLDKLIAWLADAMRDIMDAGTALASASTIT